MVPPPPALAAGLAVLLVLLLLAPPESNYFWGVNGSRSLAWPATAGLLLAACAAGLLVLVPRSGRVWAAVVGLSVALAVAFPLRERIHFLGDTQLRLRFMWASGAGVLPSSYADWASRLNAAPLDIVVNLMAPVAAFRAGWALRDGVSAVSVALALIYFAALWRVATRLGAPAETRFPLAIALGLTGVLEVFAGYAEVAGLLAAATAWWWSEVLEPLSGPRQSFRLLIVSAAVALSHHMGVVLALPLAWRALGPAWQGDRPAGRRTLAITMAVILVLTPAGQRGGLAARILLSRLCTLRLGDLVPSDWLNTLVLLAPFGLLAPLMAGRSALAGWWRHPVFALAMTVAVPLLFAMISLFPLNDGGLGAQRDWDLNVMLGVTMTVAAGALVARLPSPDLRARLAWTLPVLALLSLGFLGVQADESAAERRALALAAKPPPLSVPQRSQTYVYLGQRAMDRGQAAIGARYYDRAYELNANPRRALLAAEAWALSGNVAAARRSLDRVRAKGLLDSTLEEAARNIEKTIDAATAAPAAGRGDSAAVRR